MNKRIITLAFCLPIFVAATGQDKALPAFEGKTVQVNSSLLRNKFLHFTSFQLDSKKLSQLAHQNTVSSFRLNLGNYQQWDIDLEQSTISTPQYRLKLLTPEGMQTVSSRPDFLYRGKVRGSNKDEQVRLTIKEGFIYGSIQNGGKEYFIEPLNRFTGNKEKDQYIVYEAKNVINTESFSCGVQDKELSLKEAEKQKNLREQSPQSTVCKKIKFISVADYSIYQKFGSDVYAVETALLSNLNLAEGAFTTLNLGPDGSTDVGTDKLQFEMEEIVLTVCKECEVVGEKNEIGITLKEFSEWVDANEASPISKMFQLWTTRPIYSGAKALSGYEDGGISCMTKATCILRYNSDDPAFLRVLVAHETGHAFGCAHDDDIKVGVPGFIMYSAANASCTRFSTLADFGGVNYSSQQTIRNKVLSTINCLENCASPVCEDVKDLQMKSFDDSVQFTWSGSSNFIYRYKLLDSPNYTAKEITSNTATLKDLQPCSLYEFGVQRTCAANVGGNFSSIIFNPSSLQAKPSAINLRNSLYDLKLDIDCKHCNSNQYLVSIDRRKYNAAVNNTLHQIIVENLFADGARHRIDITKDTTENSCSTTAYFTAPYYRANSNKIFAADFNDCSPASGWKDSVLKSNASFPTPFWYRDAINFYTTKTSGGSIDSSCMIYYSSYSNAYRGTLSLISPTVDLSVYKDVYFHFDFNFLSYRAPNGHDFGSFWIEAYNGNSWEEIFEYTQNEPFPRSLLDLKNLWDSMPQRVFLDLSKYKNKDFQIRIVVDDGQTRYDVPGQVFAAFDNLMLDGYSNDSENNNIVVYPNPTKNEVLVRFSQQPVTDISYCVIDISGRIVSKGTLNNFRINMSRLTSGMYLLVLYEEDKIIANKKILKQ